jgi:hypothetical protein
LDIAGCRADQECRFDFVFVEALKAADFRSTRFDFLDGPA